MYTDLPCFKRLNSFFNYYIFNIFNTKLWKHEVIVIIIIIIIQQLSNVFKPTLLMDPTFDILNFFMYVYSLSELLPFIANQMYTKMIRRNEIKVILKECNEITLKINKAFKNIDVSEPIFVNLFLIWILIYALLFLTGGIYFDIRNGFSKVNFVYVVFAVFTEFQINIITLQFATLLLTTDIILKNLNNQLVECKRYILLNSDKTRFLKKIDVLSYCYCKIIDLSKVINKAYGMTAAALYFYLLIYIIKIITQALKIWLYGDDLIASKITSSVCHLLKSIVSN